MKVIVRRQVQSKLYLRFEEMRLYFLRVASCCHNSDSDSAGVVAVSNLSGS